MDHTELMCVLEKVIGYYPFNQVFHFIFAVKERTPEEEILHLSFKEVFSHLLKEEPIYCNEGITFKFDPDSVHKLIVMLEDSLADMGKEFKEVEIVFSFWPSYPPDGGHGDGDGGGGGGGSDEGGHGKDIKKRSFVSKFPEGYERKSRVFVGTF